MYRFLLLVLALSSVSCRGIGEMLRKYGYTEVRPASLMFAPGTLVYIRTTKPFEAGLVCKAEAALSANFKPMESKTMSSEMSKVGKKSLTLEVDVANVVNSNNDLHDIRSMKMTLSNASILEVTDADVDTHSLYASRACLRNIKRRRDAGFVITMISSALKADVSYSINWDKGSKLSADAKIEALASLSGKLGIEGSVISDRTIHAEGLYWGIRDDQFLAHIFDPENLPPVDRGSRAFDPNLVANFIGAMDAPRGSAPAPRSIDGALVSDAELDEQAAPRPGNGARLLPPAQFTLEPADPDDGDADDDGEMKPVKLFADAP